MIFISESTSKDKEYDQRKISIMFNCYDFNYWCFFILQDVNQFFLIMKFHPKESFIVRNKCYQSLKNARIAASKISKPRKSLNKIHPKPYWGPFYTPLKHWLENILNGYFI